MDGIDLDDEHFEAEEEVDLYGPEPAPAEEEDDDEPEEPATEGEITLGGAAAQKRSRAKPAAGSEPKKRAKKEESLANKIAALEKKIAAAKLKVPTYDAILVSSALPAAGCRRSAGAARLAGVRL